MLEIEKIESSEEFCSINLEWKNLENKCNNRILTINHEWLKTYWESFRDVEDSIFGFNKRLCVLLLREDGVLTAAAPFIRVDRIRKIAGKKLRLRYIEFLGQQWACIYSDLISSRRESCLGLFLDYLDENEDFDILKLLYIPDFSKNFNGFERYMHDVSTCTELPIGADYPEIIKESYSKNLKKNLKKYNNKLSRSGILINYKVLQDPGDIIKIMDDLKAVSGTKLLSNKHSNYEDKDKGKFMSDIIMNVENPYCVAYFEKEICIAYNTGFLYNGVVYAIDGSYDRNYENPMNISFGSLVIDRTVYHYSGKYNSLCLGPGADSYKFHFSRKLNYLRSFIYPGNTLRSGICRYLLNRKAIAQERELYKQLEDI